MSWAEFISAMRPPFQGMTVGDIALALEPLDGDLSVLMPDGEYPNRLFSYRGYYEDLAIGVDEWKVTETELDPQRYSDDYDVGSHELRIGQPDGITTVAEFRKAFDLIDGAVMEGYKGGQYEMDCDTPVWATTQQRDVPDLAVSGIEVEDGAVHIRVKKVDQP